jgi:mono/diheme cytochrome c family protein
VRIACLALLGLALAGCGGPVLNEAAARGQTVYLAQCTSCHASDPSQPGPVGPPLKGSSRELIDAKVLRGTYPPGYTPKRSSTLMRPLPQLAPDIGGLAAFLSGQ